MTVEMGDILKSKITEDLHRVKKIEDAIVILEDESGFTSVSLRKENLDFYFEKINGGGA